VKIGKNHVLKWWLVAAFGIIVLLSGCRAEPQPPPAVYSLPEIKYLLLTEYKDFFWCDPEFYPVAREGVEEKNSIEQFGVIRADKAEFSAILKQLALPDKADYTAAEKLAIYREHKKLTFPIQTTATTGGYQFILRVGEGQGQSIEGTISTAGKIRVTKREASFNTCPICLALGTLIDTPGGPVAVEKLRSGMEVWSMDSAGKRVAVPVVSASASPVPRSFQIIRLMLEDGRSVMASPGHPGVEGKTLAEYRPGDLLDGAVVTSVEYIVYGESATYDILPSGATGWYWANGILLKSTLTVGRDE
jgi:hypothetical protein